MSVNFINAELCSSPVSIVVYSNNVDKKEDFYLARPKTVNLKVSSSPRKIKAFCDKNNDLIYQSSELYAEVDVKNKAPSMGWESELFFKPGNGKEDFSPPQLVLHALDKLSGENVFSLENVKQGLWEPAQFNKRDLRGLYRFNHVSETKETILFVHGIGGSPLDFNYFDEKLNDRYQLMFYFYPTGANISDNGLELFRLFSLFERRNPNNRVHLVAHSMGGLVSRYFLNQCEISNNCRTLETFTSISTPWSGHYLAELGAKYAPNKLPVWEDLVPENYFLSELTETPIPARIPHYLYFGFKQRDMLVLESNDGVVSLKSMLNRKVQTQAEKVEGFNEDHTGILTNDEVIDKILFNISKVDE